MKLSVISPTYNEAENVRPFVEAVCQALQGCDFEIWIVDDDSPDLTWQIAQEISIQFPRVRVLRRMHDRGLGRAVVDGFDHANGEIVACLDADLQHDPRILSLMLREFDKGCDLVAASRYTLGGGISDWSWARRFASYVATKTAQLCLGVELSDPMSGYFMLRREDFRAIKDQLDPQGFKILLEIVAKLRPRKIVEACYTFRPRTAGQSKLSTKIAFQYLHQLWRLSAKPSVSHKIETCS
jgi:dolichol-phosphate mannosyltransferase